MKGTMLAAMYFGPKDVKIEEMPIPGIEEDGILIKIGAATTCGTDVKMYVRGYPELPILPMPYGHECAGIVAEVGSKVKDFEVGQRVVSGIAAPCGKCYYCKRNQPVFCIDRTYLIPGGAMAGGAYAEYIAVPGVITRNNVHEIPGNLSFAEAAMIEPLACALYGIEDLPEIRIGDSVVIIGDGAIGLFFLRLAKLKGAYVVHLGSRKDRLEKAHKLGADVVIDRHLVEDQTKSVYDALGGFGPDVVIESTGLPNVWELAVNMARRGGTVMLFGGCKGGTTVTFDTRKIHYDCLTIKSPSVYLQTPDLLKRCLYLFASGEIPGREFISGTFPLVDTVKAIEKHMNREGLKFEVIPPSFWK
jgi:L-iditol 2-dehydrogenase